MSDMFDMFRVFIPTPEEIRQELPNIFHWQSSWLRALNAPDTEENLRTHTSVVTAPVQWKNNMASHGYWEGFWFPDLARAMILQATKPPPARSQRRLRLVVPDQKSQDFSHWPYKNKTGT